MKKIIVLIGMLCCFIGTKAQNMQVFQIYNSQGEKVSYTDFVKEVSKNDIVLFGEMHNCPVTHWLEKNLAISLLAIHKNKLVLGAEMFESDNQLIMNEFLSNLISEERFEKEMRLWPNYTTDYKALIDFAKENKLPFIATNIPRRYARIVKKNGLKKTEGILNSQAKEYIAPMPIPYETDSSTVNFFKMMGRMGHHKSNPEFMSQAQAIKDATMAWNIAQKTKNGNCFLHYNGSYHSDSASGIPFYLKKYTPQLNVVRITATRQDNIHKIDEKNKDKADFIITIRKDFPFSY